MLHIASIVAPPHPAWHRLLRCVLILACVLVPATVRADDTSLGRTPDGVYPMNDPDIMMVDENVTVRHMSGEPSDVECVFTFYNDTDHPRTVLMGFPAVPVISENRLESTEEAKPYDFKVWVDGVRVEVHEESGTEPPTTRYRLFSSMKPIQSPEFQSWYTFEVNFPAWGRVEVRNTYHVKNAYVSNGDVLLGYMLTTGRTWKGPIGHAKVTFELNGVEPYELVNLYPSTFRFEEQTVVWEKSNFEPIVDLAVILNDRNFQEFWIDEMGPEYRAEVEEVKEAFEELGQLEAGKDRVEILRRYHELASGRGLVFGGDDYAVVMARMLLSKLEPGAVPRTPPEITSLEVHAGYRVQVRLRDADADIVAYRLVARHVGGDGQSVIADYASKLGDYYPHFDYDLGLISSDFNQAPILFEVSVVDGDSHLVRALFSYDGKAVERIESPPLALVAWVMLGVAVAAVGYRRVSSGLSLGEEQRGE